MSASRRTPTTRPLPLARMWAERTRRVADEVRRLGGPLAAHELLRRVRARLYARLAAVELPYVGPDTTIEPSATLSGTRRIRVGHGTNISEHARPGSGEFHLAWRSVRWWPRARHRA